jgi:hypothetical protein
MLELDHVNNDGGKDRKNHKHKRGGARLADALRIEGWPTGYQTLCSCHNRKKQIMLLRGEQTPV